MKTYYYDNDILQFRYYLITKCGTSTMREMFNIPQNQLQLRKPSSTSYFSFTFVRNPWSRLVSTWKDKCFSDTTSVVYKEMYSPYRNSFKDFIFTLSEDPDKFYATWEGIIDRHVRPYIDLCPLNDIDFIGRFENLQHDFNTVCDKIGIPQKKLPHRNKTKHKHYTEYYDDETREIVAKKYAKDIEYSGYEFGE